VRGGLDCDRIRRALLEVGRKITDIVLADAVPNEAELFQVAAFCDLLTAKVAKYPIQIAVQGDGELMRGLDHFSILAS
jgi:hypothetical protein